MTTAVKKRRVANQAKKSGEHAWKSGKEVYEEDLDIYFQVDKCPVCGISRVLSRRSIDEEPERYYHVPGAANRLTEPKCLPVKD